QRKPPHFNRDIPKGCEKSGLSVGSEEIDRDRIVDDAETGCSTASSSHPARAGLFPDTYRT
ncbi:MAG TPA: hypothetical protein VFQ82_00735, partial [Stellaceae bacterium]|nr:hypothetical protein [Stellaceae bacterium]